MWLGVRCGVPRKSVWSIVYGPLHPLSSEVVGHDSTFKALEARVLNLIEPMIVKNWYERVVVSQNCEVWKACKEQFAFGDGP